MYAILIIMVGASVLPILTGVTLTGAAILGAWDFVASARARRKAQKRAALLFAEHDQTPASPGLAREDIEQLPDLLRDYILRSGAMEAPALARTLRMRQKGAVRLSKKGSAWKPWEGKCFITSGHTGGIVWYADLTVGMFLSRTICLSTAPGEAEWEDDLLGFKLTDSPLQSGGTRVSALFMYYASLVWRPQAWADPAICWEQFADGGLQATFPGMDIPFALQLRMDPASGNIGTLTLHSPQLICSMQYEAYQFFQGVLRPMRWAMELRNARGRTQIALQGNITDLVADAPYAWW